MASASAWRTSPRAGSPRPMTRPRNSIRGSQSWSRPPRCRLTTQEICSEMATSLIEIETRTPPTVLENRLQTGTPAHFTVDVQALERDLIERIEGEVRFSDGD